MIVQEKDAEHYKFQPDICENDDLGQMYLVYNKILVVNCSKEVYLYKLETDEDEEDPDDETKRIWQNYQIIEG